MSSLIEAGRIQGVDIEGPRTPELGRSSIVVATDIEGPHLLGDTALNVMSSHVRPENNGNNEIDYGGILYGETYNWFEENFDTKGLGQEGSDIILAMPALLFLGVSAEIIKQEAGTSRRTPGSEEYVIYLRSKGAIIIGVTTAWRDAHEDIVIKKVGLDGIVGTDFPIDQARNRLISSGKWEEEIGMTRDFLLNSFAIIEQIANSEGEEKKARVEQLRKLIGQFYVGALGVSWDSRGKLIVTEGKATELARIMAECDVIGDKRKAEVAYSLYARHGNQESAKISIGDGFNDRRMLSESPWSIGINGADAAKAAKIGIIAPDVGLPLIVVTELIQRNSLATEINIQSVIDSAQKALGDKAIVHRGGSDISGDLLAKHKAMKKEIRGKGSLLP